ncbi:hypothetical protein Leryth_023378, partial [Lithospermum erythrorhizon]
SYAPVGCNGLLPALRIRSRLGRRSSSLANSSMRLLNTVVENRHPSCGLMMDAIEVLNPAMFELIQKKFDACKIYKISLIEAVKS